VKLRSEASEEFNVRKEKEMCKRCEGKEKLVWFEALGMLLCKNCVILTLKEWAIKAQGVMITDKRAA